jgi:transposase
VVAVACLFTWYGLAELWAAEGLPFVLGQALSMKASHGGKAKHDKRDSHKLAVLLRGGMLPQASGYPADLRAPRALGRRRPHLRRKRAELLAPVHTTTSPYHWPESGQKIAYPANRAGGAERCADPAVPTNIEGDWALVPYDAPLLTDVALSIVKAAPPHDAQPLYRLPTVPGIGKILSLVLRSEIHDIERVPRGQDVVSYGRFGNCAKAAAGQRLGTSGQQIGNAHLQGALSDATALCLRHHLAGPKYLVRWEKKPGTGTALTILAPTLARAVSDMLKRPTACAMDLLLHA